MDLTKNKLESFGRVFQELEARFEKIARIMGRKLGAFDGFTDSVRDGIRYNHSTQYSGCDREFDYLDLTWDELLMPEDYWIERKRKDEEAAVEQRQKYLKLQKDAAREKRKQDFLKLQQEFGEQ